MCNKNLSLEQTPSATAQTSAITKLLPATTTQKLAITKFVAAVNTQTPDTAKQCQGPTLKETSPQFDELRPLN
ncbi:hypothetical protein DSO57_1024844 [Entomophthora muscae]|uniref:Uncharacterized protein n=1 Tax=Entomophthora muscae TaxID=34485 RepID=A0ACC2UPI2_9FUNG|nr:hypothetical protein DSO57_1024844 [Entomophthora muscae]